MFQLISSSSSSFANSVLAALGKGGQMEEEQALRDQLELAELEASRPGSGVESAEHLFRLFVGWVPKLFTESELKPLFDQWGVVRDIIVLRDKVTGQPRGCAFVSYATREEAEAAIRHLDRRVQLPGALNKLEVRFARSHQYVQAGSGPEDNRQLFFARAPATALEPDIMALFSRFGAVEEINVFRERRSNQSKGCGFVTMASRAEAVAAMDALDERHLMEGCATPLSVKWADPELQLKKRRAVEESNTDNRMLFFAKVLRSASDEEVRALFGRYGRVFEVNLFRAFQGAPTSKGCGLVTMGSNEEAAAAIDALDQKHTWEGMDAPMVVKWMDAALQKRRRDEHLAAMRQGLVPSMGSSSGSVDPCAPRHPAPPLPGLGSLAGAGAAAGAGIGGGHALQAAGLEMAAQAQLVLPAELPPPGCAPDAYKLFVGNVPKSYVEEELRPLFELVGPVVELVIVRDKFSHESKGSAFVWYKTRADADRAAAQLNLRHSLRDPSGDQERPLVVRRANTRKPAAPLGLAGYGAASLQQAQPSQQHQQQQQQQQQLAMLALQQQQQQQQQQVDSGSGAFVAYETFQLMPPPCVLGGSGAQMAGMQLQPVILRAGGGGRASSSGGQLPVVYQPMVAMHTPGAALYPAGPASSGTNVVLPSAGNGALSGGSTLASTGGNSGVSGGSASGLLSVASGFMPSSSGGGDGDDRGGQLALQLPVTAGQMAVLTGHVYSIQMMSDAKLSSQAVGPGMFCLIISGGKSQVEVARQMVASVISSLP